MMWRESAPQTGFSPAPTTRDPPPLGSTIPISVGRECGAAVCTWKIDDLIARSAGQIDQINVGVTTLISGIRDTTPIGTDRWMHADHSIVGHLARIRAIVIGKINFFLAAAG